MNLPLRGLRPGLFSGKVGLSSRLSQLEGFGSNPGHLKALHYQPENASAENLPLVVVLHGCTQTAASYDQGSGWSGLASDYGFAVLFPEQQRENNPTSCFNWFQTEDIRRGGGEALSIAQMIVAMIERHGIDRHRVYITGLSAGGAMTSVMLATYPELFAGGAILAGLPHGAASSVPEALQQMRAHSPSAKTTGRSIQNASGHEGPWPTVSIWHGTADSVVSPTNADAILRQWREVHEASEQSTEEDQVSGYPHRVWRDGSGKLLIEEYRVTGMGHGTPLATSGDCGCGQAGAFMLEVGISSTVESAKTWGLLNERCKKAQVKAGVNAVKPAPVQNAKPAPAASGTADYITGVIEDALRKAGLYK